MRKKQILAVVLAGAFCTTAHAATLALSNFNTDAEGWSAIATPGAPSGASPAIGFTYSVTWANTGGNPGGSISESDQDADVYYFSAPIKFLGNQSAALGGTLSFDIADTPNTTNINANESPIILVGATESIYFPDNPTITSAFSHLTFTLSAGHGGAVNSQGGAAATNTDFATVLGNLQAVYVLGDYWFQGDTATLDNVTLSSVPEPTTTAAVGLGVAGLAAWVFKCRRRHAR